MDALQQTGRLDILREIAWKGSQRAADALGQFSGNMLTVQKAEVCITSVEEFPDQGHSPEEVVVGIDFAIEGDIEGYLLAIFELPDAVMLIEALMGERIRALEELNEMQLSALGEAGNIIVLAFLICLETLCGVSVMPSPPAVAVEMHGAILTSAIMPVVLSGGEVLIIDAEIAPVEAVEQVAACRILFLPTPDAWSLLYQAFTAQQHKREVTSATS